MAPEPDEELKDEKNPRPLDEDDIALLKTYVCCLLFRLFGIPHVQNPNICPYLFPEIEDLGRFNFDWFVKLCCAGSVCSFDCR